MFTAPQHFPLSKLIRFKLLFCETNSNRKKRIANIQDDRSTYRFAAVNPGCGISYVDVLHVLFDCICQRCGLSVQSVLYGGAVLLHDFRIYCGVFLKEVNACGDGRAEC